MKTDKIKLSIALDTLSIALDTLSKLNKCTCFMKNRDYSQGGLMPIHSNKCATSIILEAMERINSKTNAGELQKP